MTQDTHAIDLEKLFALDAFEALAEQRMSIAARDLVQLGAGAGAAISNNRAAWRRIALRSRVLRNVSSIDLTTTVLGQPVSLPVLIAPSGLHGLTHPEAEAATARAAHRDGTIMTLSMNSTLPVETVALEQATLWFQLYWGKDRGFVRALIDRAAAAGCTALCLTLDMPVRPWVLAPMRQALQAVGDIQPAHGFPRSGHLAGTATWDQDATLTWSDLDWLKANSALPLILKGIMHPDDAVAAADNGADAIIVSNHGGRLLEDGLSTAEALPEIAEAVNGRLEILVDGGVRRGSDVIKAMALGARAVMIGRPAMWGLALGGDAGVSRVLEILRGEMASAMGMMGLSRVGQIDQTVVRINPA